MVNSIGVTVRCDFDDARGSMYKFFLILYYEDGRKEEIQLTEEAGDWLRYAL